MEPNNNDLDKILSNFFPAMTRGRHRFIFRICFGHIPVQCFLSWILIGEGPGCQDVHQVADPPSENKTSQCTVVFFILQRHSCIFVVKMLISTIVKTKNLSFSPAGKAVRLLFSFRYTYLPRRAGCGQQRGMERGPCQRRGRGRCVFWEWGEGWGQRHLGWRWRDRGQHKVRQTWLSRRDKRI